MRFHSLLVFFAASAALAQQPVGVSPAAPLSSSERFYKDFQVTPMADGKVLIVMDDGSRKYNAVGAEPVPPKDGGPVTQWTLYNGGFVTLYSKKTIVIPNPNGGEGTPVDGIAVTSLTAPPPSSSPGFTGHQTSSKYTTPARKDKDFRMPFRIDKAGFYQRPRIWLLWDGKKEIEVEPMGINFSDQWWRIPGFGNHLKYLSNVRTENSPAPRFFYMQRNKDESMTVYGDDDIEKLNVIEKNR
jgi:hypothetical protein